MSGMHLFLLVSAVKSAGICLKAVFTSKLFSVGGISQQEVEKKFTSNIFEQGLCFSVVFVLLVVVTHQTVDCVEFDKKTSILYVHKT